MLVWQELILWSQRATRCLHVQLSLKQRTSHDLVGWTPDKFRVHQLQENNLTAPDDSHNGGDQDTDNSET
eukprot:4753174-Amphidinium_carterae.1